MRDKGNTACSTSHRMQQSTACSIVHTACSRVRHEVVRILHAAEYSMQLCTPHALEYSTQLCTPHAPEYRKQWCTLALHAPEYITQWCAPRARENSGNFTRTTLTPHSNNLQHSHYTQTTYNTHTLGPWLKGCSTPAVITQHAVRQQ